MNRLRLTLRSLAYYRRTHAGVAAGAAVTAAVLSGALIVGDSISNTLRAQAAMRIGSVDQAMFVNDRLFRADLADRIESVIQDVGTAPILLVRGVASSPDGSRTARQVNVMGVDKRFFEFAPDPDAAEVPERDGSLLLQVGGNDV